MTCWNHCGRRVHHGLFSLAMRILITGGFGFVGGRLAAHLAQAGHQIILGTRYSIDSPDWLKQAKVAKIAWDDEVALERSCDGVDVIIHAAGMNALDCTTDPIAALKFNGLATAKLAEAASRASVGQFIYLSTAHVYASPLIGVISEETNLCNLHPYATSHLAGERALLNVSNHVTLQSIVLRLSNAFGRPMHKNANCWMLLINDLCKQAVVTHKLVLHTSGLQERDFISLSNVCHVAEKLIAHTQLKKTNMFNLGTGVSKSVLEMAKIVQQRCTKVLGFTPELQYKQAGGDELPLTFTYRTDNLNALGINCTSQEDPVEIDELLQFCQMSFG